MRWREAVRESDPTAVRRLVQSTSFFSAAEVDIAVELVDEALADGKASGYDFVFVDSDITAGELLGYACFGPIPLREAAYDLYWIAVAPGRQQQGLGKRLLLHAEERAAEQGAVAMYIDTSGRAQYVPTRQFYERAGYTTHEVLPDFYATGDDKVVYRKRLDRASATRAGPEILVQ